MTEAIIVSLITGGLSLVGVVITNMVNAKKAEKSAAVAQAVMDTKLEALTREVREHNNFALRMPVLEQRITSVERRVDILEHYHQSPTN